MLISTALLLDSNIRNSVCTQEKLPCRRVVEGSGIIYLANRIIFQLQDKKKREIQTYLNVILNN
jgi:hypothetical protein